MGGKVRNWASSEDTLAGDRAWTTVTADSEKWSREQRGLQFGSPCRGTVRRQLDTSEPQVQLPHLHVSLADWFYFPKSSPPCTGRLATSSGHLENPL